MRCDAMGVCLQRERSAMSLAAYWTWGASEDAEMVQIHMTQNPDWQLGCDIIKGCLVSRHVESWDMLNLERHGVVKGVRREVTVAVKRR
jgi:hypothetical protein